MPTLGMATAAASASRTPVNIAHAASLGKSAPCSRRMIDRTCTCLLRRPTRCRFLRALRRWTGDAAATVARPSSWKARAAVRRTVGDTDPPAIHVARSTDAKTFSKPTGALATATLPKLALDATRTRPRVRAEPWLSVEEAEAYAPRVRPTPRSRSPPVLLAKAACRRSDEPPHRHRPQTGGVRDAEDDRLLVSMCCGGCESTSAHDLSISPASRMVMSSRVCGTRLAARRDADMRSVHAAGGGRRSCRLDSRSVELCVTSRHWVPLMALCHS